MATDPTTFEEKIGSYKVIRTLLRGQTCDVLEVVQDGSGKRFALKQLRESSGVDASEKRAFAFEAKLGMELSHPNLIRVYEFNPKGLTPYFLMDYFPSISLRPMIAQPDKYPLNARQKRRVIEQSATALLYMHEKGWVHRDIKPENVLVNKVGEARLIDYALAKRPKSGMLNKLFGGKVPREGTPSYMSPEQILCRPPSIRADIYSFGILCYEIACGRQPFRANSQNELLQKHIRERPASPINHNKGITPEYADLTLSMIAKDPAKRPESMRDFLMRFRKVRIYQDDPDPLMPENNG